MDSPLFGAGGGHQLLGFVDTASPPSAGSLGGIERLGSTIHSLKVQTIIVDEHLDLVDLDEVLDKALAAECQVLAIPQLLRIGALRPAIFRNRGQDFLELTSPGTRSVQLALKRVLDVALSLPLLAVLLPIFAIAALLVKLTSRGPVLFRQQRIGRCGRPFTILKFRTMSVDAEARRSEVEGRSLYGDPRLFKVVQDPRVTGLGRVLRRTSIDELPQLFNVLRGEMSLVGPRPPLPSEVKHYEERHHCRFDVTPGITGPWQVAGRNQITDFDRIVFIERQYAARWSLMLDLMILARTIPVVLTMSGAH